MEGGHSNHNNGAHPNSTGQNIAGGMDQMHHYPANMMPPNGAPLGVPPPGLFMPPQHMQPGMGIPNPYMMYPHPPQGGMPPVPPASAAMMPPHMFAPKVRA